MVESASGGSFFGLGASEQEVTSLPKTRVNILSRQVGALPPHHRDDTSRDHRTLPDAKQRSKLLTVTTMNSTMQ